MLETIDFSFGGKICKVAEAGLLFSYEIGMERGRIYVVALTQNFGTILFYIPENILKKIIERAKKFSCPFKEYLSFLIKFRDFESIMAPFLRYGISPMEAAAKIDAALTPLTCAQLPKKIPVNRKAKTNSWLKKHGYPMRRKGKGKKKHE